MRRESKIIYFIFIFLVFVSSFLYFVVFKSNRYQVIFCNVGQGDGILIKDGKEEIVIDAGPDNGQMKRCLDKFLSFDDRKIEKIIASHYDSDHIGGFRELFEAYEIGEVYGLGGSPKETKTYLNFKEMLKKSGKREEKLIYGMVVGTKNAKLRVLYPFYNSLPSNNFSVVLKLSYLGKAFLLGGDLEIGDWMELISHFIDLRSDIFKVSHHGSRNGMNEEIIEKIKPKEAVISVGKNSYGHPHPEVLKILKDNKILIRRTDEEGDIVY